MPTQQQSPCRKRNLMQQNEIEVTYVRLHELIFVPNTVGQIGPVLTAEGPTAKTHDLKMWLTQDNMFLLVILKNHKVMVPMANVAFFVPKI